ncbi:ATP-dependent RNA helicase HelY [Neomicrococcus aestuarii]|uniref:ATP-dependent RNA helicase HelY n=1 Tax=Neomicrococcus aestuarii TaxID=556325 RepID=A0A7W8TS20_9MICC|nr:DEAD/DEAH box helicase [Neomicrococcus aestuarii]MBB5511892.1 ATP-dependent RNA helicase HelY [Neomicrococcus aestuarii]
MTSPAERYAAAKIRAAEAKTLLYSFRQEISFELDGFQIEACRELESGRGVLVAAPTGAGKTVVGEFAVYLALQRDGKCFYTTPIKALSNQKFQEFSEKYGPERVGLLTGDTSINPEAEIVVMTTEVLRNMLYADSDTLRGLSFVVMDEVHYLADKFRGAVWEEVIIHLPDSVQVVSLSATVSNAEEFGGWLDAVRGDTAIIVSEHRPIPLFQHVMVGGRIVDLFAEEVSFDEAGTEQRREALTVNPELLRIARHDRATTLTRSGRGGSSRRDREEFRASRGGKAHGGAGRGKGDRRFNNRDGSGTWDGSKSRDGAGKRDSSSKWETTEEAPRFNVSRPHMIRALEAAGLLPAIVFIFSRKGCDAAVSQCVRSGLKLTNDAESREIAAIVDDAAKDLNPSDLDVLGFWSWRDGLINGFAAHHAGMLPVFKEVVEKLFAEGYVRAVFATETLALGVNMPARSVVLEKLVKFNGEEHVQISPGEYTQLTGRAGRRGIDVEGHGVVLWQPGTDPAAVAGLASKRTYPLNSSFRPTYNMSLNLTAQFGRERGRGILESSFAQFQADRSVVGLARKVRGREESLAGYAESMKCHLGDFSEYAKLRRELSQAEKDASSSERRMRRGAAAASLEGISRGDVLLAKGPRGVTRCVVLETSRSLRDPSPTILTEDGKIKRLNPLELDSPVVVHERLRIPNHFTGRTPRERRDLASSLRNLLQDKRPPKHFSRAFSYEGSDRIEAEITRLRKELRHHPCHGCSDREEHARWADRWWSLRKETDQLKAQIGGRTNTIAKIYDRVCAVLNHYGYLKLDEEMASIADGSHARYSSAGQVPESGTDLADPALDAAGIDGSALISQAGQRLRRIYGERDMLTSLVLESGVMENLDPEELAAFITTLVFQAKREERMLDVKLPSPGIHDAWDVAVREWSELTDLEEEHHLPQTAAPELGLVWPMFHWARGKDLGDAIKGTDLAAGDFVRWAKQVIDSLDQLAKVQGISPKFAKNCRRAVDLVRRGVVIHIGLGEVD